MSTHGNSGKQQGSNNSTVAISQLIAAGGKPPKIPAPPILTEILPERLYISNLEGANAVDKLVALGITHVVALLKTKMNNPYPASIQRLWVPVVDTAAAVDGFERIWPTPLQFLRECMDRGGRALVHCRAGMSRSSTIVLAHMLEYHHYILRDAWVTLYTKHPIASPLTPFFKALVVYEWKLHQLHNTNTLPQTPSNISCSPRNPNTSTPPSSSASSSTTAFAPVRPVSPPASSAASSLSPPAPDSGPNTTTATTNPTLHSAPHAVLPMEGIGTGVGVGGVGGGGGESDGIQRLTSPSSASSSDSVSPSPSTPKSNPFLSPVPAPAPALALAPAPAPVPAPNSSVVSSAATATTTTTTSSVSASASTSASTSPATASSPSTPSIPFKSSITLMDYHLQMVRTIFPTTKEKDFVEVVKQCNGNWLTAARVYHQHHPNVLNSFAMRFGGGASFYHPFCDGV